MKDRQSSLIRIARPRGETVVIGKSVKVVESWIGDNLEYLRLLVVALLVEQFGGGGAPTVYAIGNTAAKDLI